MRPWPGRPTRLRKAGADSIARLERRVPGGLPALPRPRRHHRRATRPIRGVSRGNVLARTGCIRSITGGCVDGPLHHLSRVDARTSIHGWRVSARRPSRHRTAPRRRRRLGAGPALALRRAAHAGRARRNPPPRPARRPVHVGTRRVPSARRLRSFPRGLSRTPAPGAGGGAHPGDGVPERHHQRSVDSLRRRTAGCRCARPRSEHLRHRLRPAPLGAVD